MFGLNTQPTNQSAHVEARPSEFYVHHLPVFFQQTCDDDDDHPRFLGEETEVCKG